MESFLKVTRIEAHAYGEMKAKLGMKSDEDFLKYMRVKTINQFNQKNLIIGINPTVELKKPNAPLTKVIQDEKENLDEENQKKEAEKKAAEEKKKKEEEDKKKNKAAAMNKDQGVNGG